MFKKNIFPALPYKKMIAYIEFKAIRSNPSISHEKIAPMLQKTGQMCEMIYTSSSNHAVIYA